MKETKENLLNGSCIVLESQEDILEFWFSEKLQKFCVEFNCKLMKCTKTFEACEKEYNRLKEKYNLYE